MRVAARCKQYARNEREFCKQETFKILMLMFRRWIVDVVLDGNNSEGR